MSATIRIPRDRLSRYFNAFTKRFLKDGSPEAVDVEVLTPDLGDQIAAAGARLLGITYDPHDNALEFERVVVGVVRDAEQTCTRGGNLVAQVGREHLDVDRLRRPILQESLRERIEVPRQAVPWDPDRR